MMTYPSRIDLSMHSLQKRCRHSITVRVFRMIPIHMKTKKLMFFLFHCNLISGEGKGAMKLKEKCWKANKLKACTLIIILNQQTNLFPQKCFGCFLTSARPVSDWMDLGGGGVIWGHLDSSKTVQFNLT